MSLQIGLSIVAKAVHKALAANQPLFTESFTDATNDTGFTNTRATPQHVETDTGNLFPVPAGAITIQKARPARNLVSKPSAASIPNTVAPNGDFFKGTDTGVEDDGGDLRITTTDATHYVAVRLACQPGQVFTASFFVKKNAGTSSYELGFYNETSPGFISPKVDIAPSLTSEYKRFSVSVIIPSGCTSIRVFFLHDSASDIDVTTKNFQVQDITHRAASSVAPDEYVDSATDHGTGVNGFRYFTTALANTVDGSGVVTEGTGAALTGIALANVPGATNFDQRSTPKTADYTVQSGLTITDNADPGPFGDGSAALVTGTGTAGSYAQKSSSLVSYIAGTSYCFWQIAKPGTSSWHRMALPYEAFGTSADRDAWFHLSESGSVGTTQAKIDSAGIRLLGSSYYLCWITGTAIQNSSSRPGYIAVADADASTSSSGTVYVAHNQVEVGALPTSSIVTSGSTASTDAAVLDFSGVTGFVTPNETRIVCTGLGPNLVTNGDFSDGTTGWVGVSAVVDGEGVLSALANGENVRTNVPLEPGYKYLLKADVKSIDSGGLRPMLNSNPFGDTVTTAKTLVGVGAAGSFSGYAGLKVTGAITGTAVVDNVEIYKIDPTDTTERIIDIDNWDGTDLSDILPHANIKSVTVYAPGERP